MYLGGVRPSAFQSMTNDPMLHYAKSKADGYDGIEWKQDDASALTLSDSSFDVVYCQFGLMFVPDKLAVLKEMYRVLRSGGFLVLNVWDSVKASIQTIGGRENE